MRRHEELRPVPKPNRADQQEDREQGTACGHGPEQGGGPLVGKDGRKQNNARDKPGGRDAQRHHPEKRAPRLVVEEPPRLRDIKRPKLVSPDRGKEQRCGHGPNEEHDRAYDASIQLLASQRIKDRISGRLTAERSCGHKADWGDDTSGSANDR